MALSPPGAVTQSVGFCAHEATPTIVSATEGGEAWGRDMVPRDRWGNRSLEKGAGSRPRARRLPPCPVPTCPPASEHPPLCLG